ncbi:MAG: peptidyl-prolyl cis-trans isomerase [candidate division Zixibacteria bacterium]|nr:peptidyl-prolyl cis-trans isomerase [candidate division Zixibacteria bacterium]
MKRAVVIVAVLALSLAWITGCASKQSKIVAQIGKDKITVGELAGDYIDMKKNAQMQIISDLPLYDQFKEFLDQKIDSRLLVQAAHEKGFDKDPQIESRLEPEKEKLLMNELFRREVLSKVKVTDKDIADFYKKLGESIKVRHILVKTKKEADQIYRDLKKGADFDTLAKEKSIDTRTKDRGGDLGFISWHGMVGAAPFKEVAFKLKPQEISHPVKTLAGWHIIKLDERKKETQKSFEEEKENLKMSLQMMNQQEIGINYMVNLMEKSDIKMVSSTIKMLEEKTKTLAATDTLKSPMQGLNLDPAQLTEEEKSLPVIKYKGGELKVSEFLPFYNRWPFFQRPALDDEENIKGLVFNYLLAPEILKKLALKKKIDQGKEYKDKLTRTKEAMIADKYRSEIIWKDLAVDSADLENFYQKNKDKYITPAQAHVLEIMVKTEDEAKQVLKQLRAGADFKKLAGEKTIRTSAKQSGGDLGRIMQSNYPELFEAAFKLKKNEIGGPIHLLQGPVGEGYSVIKLLEKTEQKQKTLAEVEPTVRNGATYEKKNSVSRKWVEEARAKTEIKINEPALQEAFRIVQKELPPQEKM